MKNIVDFQGAAALGGYVRAVFSGRLCGFAAPVDLVRAQLKTAAAVALRGRIRAAFADYLVTDGGEDDSALRLLEIGGRWLEAKAPAFSPRRAFHAGFHEVLTVTGGGEPLDYRYRSAAGGALDAPGCLPAGACDSVGPLFGGSPQIVALREPIESGAEAPFSEAREKYSSPVDRLCSTGFWFVNMEQCGALDAPMFMAAGSVRCFEDRDVGEVRAPRIILRAGWLQ